MKQDNITKKPDNITNAEELEKSGVQISDPVHVGVVGPGQSTNDAKFVRRLTNGNQVQGVILNIRGKEIELPWGDLMEFWPLPCPFCLSGPEKDYRIEEFQKKING